MDNAVRTAARPPRTMRVPLSVQTVSRTLGRTGYRPPHSEHSLVPQTYRYECARLLTFPENPEFAAVLGVAVYVPIAHFPLAFDVRYAPGLFDIGESQFQRGTNFPEHHNVTLSASLGILLGGSH